MTPREVAQSKMSAVLGEVRANQLIDRIGSETRNNLETPDDLMSFSRELSKRGGIEGAVGGMLGVQAVLQGAREPI